MEGLNDADIVTSAFFRPTAVVSRCRAGEDASEGAAIAIDRIAAMPNNENLVIGCLCVVAIARERF
jgi:hypothetical protein